MDALIPWLETLTFWHWMVLGVVLVIVELLMPGIWALWLGIGAFATGIVVLFPAQMSWQAQIVLYCVLSVASIVVGRLIVRGRAQPEDHPTLNRRAENYVGQVFPLIDATENGRGRVRIGDSVWRVRLATPGGELPAGGRVRVTGIDGATLQVEPQGSD